MSRLPSLEDRGAGVPLTRFERSRIDFTRTSVVHARWCKAAAYEAGCRDWTAYYDPTLSPAEHVEIYGRATGDPDSAPTLRHTNDAVLAKPRPSDHSTRR